MLNTSDVCFGVSLEESWGTELRAGLRRGADDGMSIAEEGDLKSQSEKAQ